ncbi:Glutaredoxin (GrxC) [Fructobacillus fructosus]|uniref:glutaredoxin-like protein NrdH n=1 Tax=Fructobacillus fructosus TaxID=1631 RepID=UPI000219606C|nr:glutaredoxin-like protein NrdH [Fructobacillus fructosus]KRN52352.1 ribonucleoside-diphosphate reductase class Ib glutaredoxin subunit [Fructobacillus fructosus KCTC 3544]CAK1244624.1 Glutaredoxin (GrxC) [Fructobacillus fructosus]CAK1247048.1 Glutaredoxin (GrxC) [Fructobacillus fructosus]CAK1249062.1 Glutaredoxin (GrxC) [Fructobacillus fructosus]CAK1249820.1 Glutaredoxin (GrxC) [Fructobacillus fructosus]
MPQVTVFTKNNCVQCKMTKKYLDQLGVAFSEINIEEQPQYLAQLKEQGFKQTPVVQIEGHDAFSGFQPAALKKLTA